jgi:predicted HD superfamily hydrolase involved in NAD metabolism
MRHYTAFLEQVLTPPRLQHSLGVAQVMGELVEVYHLDQEQASTAGLLHDAAKDLSPEQQAQLIAESGIELTYEEERDYNLYLHGPVGAYFVGRELGITDELVLDAITMHTYCGEGKNWDDPLVWCLRFADLLEPARDWSRVRWLREGEPKLRKLVYTGRMAEAACLQTGMVIEWFDSAGMPVHPNMRRAHAAFLR